MNTLHLKNNEPTIRTVPLEDWYEELSDKSLNPEFQLIQDEDAQNEITEGDDVKLSLLQSLGAANMSSSTQNNTPKFDVKSFLATARALDDTTTSVANKVPCPEWLTLKSGVVSEQNAFMVTAGVVKATRGVMDALSYTQRELEQAIERLTMQELRSGRTSAEVHNFGPEITKIGMELAFKGTAHSDVAGFNPDGMEFDHALTEAVALVDKLEAVVKNGERIMGEILEWVIENAEPLNLKVETGHTVRLGPIGNEIRTARMERLDPNTLLVGVQLQRDFIRSMRNG